MAERRPEKTAPPLTPRIRKGQGDVALDRAEFARRFRARFRDPAFAPLASNITGLLEVAWDAYTDSRKAPRTRTAGPGHANPDYRLSLDWLAAREAIRKAERRQRNPRSANRVLLISGSTRTDQTCPGEMAKTFRLVEHARTRLRADGCKVDLLDLSRLASEYGRNIHPCKACVSTAMPLCHWPCSCYPNHALGQVNDWMNEIYPMWAGAHGVMIVTPVYWYHAPSSLKLMMDRMVCADGGNPDPTSTCGKDPARAKAIELAGWDYPRHLAGRAFSVVVHGDAAGAESLRRSLVDWLQDMQLVQAGAAAAFNRYIGYYEPYATSHDALDDDQALFEEVGNAARSLARAVSLIREGRREPDHNLKSPRPK